MFNYKHYLKWKIPILSIIPPKTHGAFIPKQITEYKVFIS
jgi:hypothetical protein